MTVETTDRTLASLLFLHAQTPMHPGSGTALGVVDLPVQRERHTQWPTIPGSSMKGVLRDACRRRGDSQLVETVFGPETENADKHAGALSVTDARIFAFPVRSLQGVFAYATSRAVLQRLRRDLQLVDRQDALAVPPPLADGQVYCPSDTVLAVGQGQIVLEEFDLQINQSDATDDLANRLAPWITDDEDLQNDFRSRLVILDDNQFTHFARHGTEVVARIKLDYQRKTVATGALFYQEYLPSETILYAMVTATAGRDDSAQSARDVLDFVRNNTPAVLQFGGDETTGKGFCHVHFATVDA